MEDGDLAIEWMSLPPAPDSVMELANCSGTCRKTRCSDPEICTCRQNNLPCTELCKCARENCDNVTGHDDHLEDDHNVDDESDPEDD